MVEHFIPIIRQEKKFDKFPFLFDEDEKKGLATIQDFIECTKMQIE
jgi:hypothetical protein